MLANLNIRHAESTAFGDSHGVGLDFGWTVNVLKTVIPEVEALVELAQVGKLVQKIEVNVEVSACGVVMLREDDPPFLYVHEGKAFGPADRYPAAGKQSASGFGIWLDALERRAFADAGQKERQSVFARWERSIQLGTWR